MAGRDVYKEVRTFRFPNMVVRVHIPDLTEEERERRMKRVHAAAESLLKDVMQKECKGNV